MITKQNLKSMLTEALHFTKATVGEFYSRHFDSVNCEVSVDKYLK